MQDGRRISLCIPNYNRVDMLLESFEKVYSDDRISEIIVSDDHSDGEVYYELESLFKLMPKVKMFRNDVNQDCYKNKHTAIELATNDWVILLDSDNIIGLDYLDKLSAIPVWDDMLIYAPCFAAPNFDFRPYAGMVVRRGNVSEYIDKPMFETMLNAANFFVNRKRYLSIWDGRVDPVTSDSIFFTYKWLEDDNVIYVVDGLEYFHRVHEGSHYKNNVARTPNGFHESILNKLRQL
jgi:glycosyltransferase involved in cell wall biosynthesis